MKFLALSLGIAVAANATAADLMAVSTAPVADLPRGVSFSATAFAADDFIAAKDIDDAWTQPADPRAGRNLAVAFGRAGLDYTGDGWSVGVFTRADGFGRTNHDSIVVYAASDDPLRLLDTNRGYGLDYEFTGFSAHGVRFAVALPLASETLSGSVALNLLKADRLRIERVVGQVEVEDGTANIHGVRTLLYDGLDYESPTDPNPGRSDFRPATRRDGDAGYGYALDFALRWQASPELRVDLAVNDLLGKLSWKNVPLLTQRVDVDGINETQWLTRPGGMASFNNTSGYQDVDLDLDPRMRLASTWTRDALVLGASLSARSGVVLPEFSAGWRFAEEGIIALSYETRFDSIGIGVRYGPFQLALRADDADFSAAKALGATIGLNYHF